MKRYNTIVMDPPWPSPSGRRDVDNRNERFPKVSLADIESFPVNDVASRDCHLYIWVMNIHAFEKSALRIMKRAGFSLKNRITWVKMTKDGTKVKFSQGNYFRLATEYMFFGVRGNAPAGTHSLSNVILAPYQGLAVKPDESYRYIEAMSPGRKLELFARRRWSADWHVWGNQIESDDVSINWNPDRAAASRGGYFADERSAWKK